jgi:Membrane domain of glycerophosphoryl diester phosphodiesterase
MTNALYPPARPQSVGEVLDLAFRIFGATLLKCLPFAALAVIAGQLPNVYSLASGQPLLNDPQLALQRFFDPKFWLLELVAIFLTVTLTNAVVLRQYALITAQPGTGGAALSAGARHAPGIVLIWILIALPWVLFGVLAGVTVAVVKGGGAQSGAALLCMLVFLIASILVLRWSCAVVVYLVTERGPLMSMSHSWQLTRGHFWRLSLIYSVGVVLLIVLYLLSGVISSVVALMFVRGNLAMITAAATVVVVLMGGFATPFYSALALAVLGDLSVRSEGSDLERRISAPAS